MRTNAEVHTGADAALAADVAGNGAQVVVQTGRVLAAQDAGRGPHHAHVHGTVGAQARDGLDGLGRNAADLFGPFGRLRLAVIFAGDDFLPALEAGRLDVLLDELGVLEPLVEDRVGHCLEHGGVGRRADGNPLVGQVRGPGIARIDVDQRNALLAGQLEVVHELGVVQVHVEAPQHDGLRIEQGHGLGAAVERRRVHGQRAAELVRVGKVVRFIGVDAPDGHGAARHELPDVVGRAAHEAVAVDGHGAVLLAGLEVLLDDEVEGLVPADALELARALGPYAQHRVLDAIGRVHVLAPAAAAGAGTMLEHATTELVLAVVGVLASGVGMHDVVGFDGGQHAVLLVALQHAHVEAAVLAAGAVLDFLAGMLVHKLLVHSFELPFLGTEVGLNFCHLRTPLFNTYVAYHSSFPFCPLLLVSSS